MSTYIKFRISVEIFCTFLFYFSQLIGKPLKNSKNYILRVPTRKSSLSENYQVSIYRSNPSGKNRVYDTKKKKKGKNNSS